VQKGRLRFFFFLLISFDLAFVFVSLESIRLFLSLLVSFGGNVPKAADSF